MTSTPKVAAIFGTRPELIKFRPVIDGLNKEPIDVVSISTGQQPDLLRSIQADFQFSPDVVVDSMCDGQSLNQLLANIVTNLDHTLDEIHPSAVMVQGDTTTALGGALSAHMRGIPVFHIEAGLRTGDIYNPFPEETNRTLISRVSTLHFAATQSNVDLLIDEGVSPQNIFQTGNPIVDAISELKEQLSPTIVVSQILNNAKNKRLVVSTLHRRENFGDPISSYLQSIVRFIIANEDTHLVLPVHPNPEVTQAIEKHVPPHERIDLIAPLVYSDFLCLLKHAWLVLSDSGGIQEEIATLGTPLIILRKKTERPEILHTDLAKIAATSNELEKFLAESLTPNSWCESATPIANPFGDGHSGARIARAVRDYFY